MNLSNATTRNLAIQPHVESPHLYYNRSHNDTTTMGQAALLIVGILLKLSGLWYHGFRLPSTKTRVVIINLCLIDLLLSIFYFTQLFVHHHNITLLFIEHTLQICCRLSMLLMSADCFANLWAPVRYGLTVRPLKLKQIAVIVWVVSCGLCVPEVVVLGGIPKHVVDGAYFAMYLLIVILTTVSYLSLLYTQVGLSKNSP